MVYKTVLFLYQTFRAIRYSLLGSVFGFTSHCKHSPTCGTRLLHTFQKKQYNQLPGCLWQLITCW